MPIRVFVTLRVGRAGHVRVAFHCLHSDTRALLACLPLGGVLHRDTLARVRDMLPGLDAIRACQREFERAMAREARATGVRRVPVAVVNPFLLHDACTLYAGCAAGAFGGGCSFRAATPCERCGGNEWAYTCTPPRLAAGPRLVRDLVDPPVAFCWTCMSRRAASTYEVVRGWRCPGVPMACRAS